MRERAFVIGADEVPEWDPKNSLHSVHKGQNVLYPSSKFMRMILAHGARCVECGVEGTHFAAEKEDNGVRYRLALYASRDDGTEVRITRDHIIPRSKGGRDIVENTQPMCEPCNVRKGNQYDGEMTPGHFKTPEFRTSYVEKRKPAAKKRNAGAVPGMWERYIAQQAQVSRSAGDVYSRLARMMLRTK